MKHLQHTSETSETLKTSRAQKVVASATYAVGSQRQQL
jgi:hypothetical protein